MENHRARTARFVLMDPWLSDAGGHNFQYALDVAQSAQQHGYDIVLGVHHTLPDALRFDASWRVLRLYRFGTCARHWLSPLGKNSHPCDLDGAWLIPAAGSDGDRTLGARGRGLLRRLLDWPAARDRRRRILDFVQGSRRLLDQIEPRRGDLFFLPSMTEFDFLGAARFLRDDPRTLDFEWHLQFHFNIFVGRDTEFPSQSARLGRFRQQLGEARRQIPGHQLRLYATTPAMARQFDAVGIGRFDPLPYPVRYLAQASDATAVRPEPLPPPGERGASATAPLRSRPLRVTFAGAMRREKGKKKLGSLIAAVWDDYLAEGRMQLVFQSTPRHIARWLPHHLRRRARIAPADSGDLSAPLQTAPYPLDAESYARLIQRSDLGVFLYDARRYYARASGVLCEMLAAGVPVIVPAGCWLADQISDAHFEHAERLCRVLEHAPAAPWTWRQEFAPGDTAVEAEGELPESTGELVLQWNWAADWPRGVFARVTTEFAAARGAPLLFRDEQVVGPSERQQSLLGCDEDLELAVGSRRAGLVIPAAPGARWARIAIRSAYDAAPVPLEEPTVRALPCLTDGGHRPLGSVGRVATSDDDVPGLIREILQHYPHYQASAREFSRYWLDRHHADRTVEILTRDPGQPSTAARAGTFRPHIADRPSSPPLPPDSVNGGRVSRAQGPPAPLALAPAAAFPVHPIRALAPLFPLAERRKG